MYLHGGSIVQTLPCNPALFSEEGIVVYIVNILVPKAACQLIVFLSLSPKLLVPHITFLHIPPCKFIKYFQKLKRKNEKNPKYSATFRTKNFHSGIPNTIIIGKKNSV